MTEPHAYFWSGGKKVALESDPHIAVDVDLADQQGLWNDALRAATDGRTGGGVILLREDAVPQRLRTSLDQVGALLPVYRLDDALIAIRPEVRVQAGSSTADEVRSAIAPVDAAAQIDEPQAGRFVIRPSSGRGADALSLANQVAEVLKPAAAQADFIQLTTLDQEGDIR